MPETIDRDADAHVCHESTDKPQRRENHENIRYDLVLAEWEHAAIHEAYGDLGAKECHVGDGDAYKERLFGLSIRLSYRQDNAHGLPTSR